LLILVLMPKIVHLKKRRRRKKNYFVSYAVDKRQERDN
jgi:hypothetical protein